MQKSRVEDNIEVNLDHQISYGDYLHLDLLLSAQQPLSEEPNELLFITIHQVQELWLKLIAHEIIQAKEAIKSDQLNIAFKVFARITRIQEQLITAWDTLSTLTPNDYLSFRDKLGRASGFQSYQYRLVEFMLGAKDSKMIEVHQHKPEIVASLRQALNAPSIYDVCLALLAKRGIPIPETVLVRDISQPYQFNKNVRDCWLIIYNDTQVWFDLYQLAEELIDLEDWFQQWRFRHLKTVERIIGERQGTGGSSGISFLKTALENSFFPELWALRPLL